MGGGWDIGPNQKYDINIKKTIKSLSFGLGYVVKKVCCCDQEPGKFRMGASIVGFRTKGS